MITDLSGVPSSNLASCHCMVLLGHRSVVYSMVLHLAKSLWKFQAGFSLCE